MNTDVLEHVTTSTGMTTSTDQPGLSIRNMTASYAGKAAIEGLSLEVRRSEFVSLLGPSGCGKTTTLRCVAGLQTPDRGDILIDGSIVHSDTVRVPVHKRDINMVFQSYAVWPHMSVLDNVAYGVRSKKFSKPKARAKALEMLELVGLAEFASRYATELSGGQQQRVALARALATEPRLILMDEPLSNLDARLRVRMRNEIRQLQRATGTTMLYVTHDQTEALAMSDRIVVMNDGAIQQVGAPWDLYNNPANRFVAGFLGEANIVEATVLHVGDDYFDARTDQLAADTSFRIALAAGEARPALDDTVSVVFRPEWLRVAEAATASSGSHSPNDIVARLVDVEFLGDRLDCRYLSGTQSITMQMVPTPTSIRPEVGMDYVLRVEPGDVAWFPHETA